MGRFVHTRFVGTLPVFDHFGNFKSWFGGFGSGDGQFNTPTDVVVDPTGRILYVVDAFNRRLQAFDVETGKFLFKWGEPGFDKGQFLNPSGIAVDMEGNVYVTDQGTQRVQKFTWKGDFISMWGKYGSAPGEFLYPQGLTVDDKNRVYVVDFGNHRGQMFTTDGEFIATYGEEVLQPQEETFKSSSSH